MNTSRNSDFDIVIISDFRYPGGTSASVAEEVRAQHRAGYRTGLIQVPAPSLRAEGPFNHKILACLHAGMAELVPADREVTARLAVLRQPRVFEQMPEIRPRLRAGSLVMVVNQAPRDKASREPYYQLSQVKKNVENMFETEITWAPIGPLVRDRVLAEGVELRTTEDDWHNIIDVDDWLVDRSRFVTDRPVIGRHTRPDSKKWPATQREVLAAYPDSTRVLVRILGGVNAPRKVLGYLPKNWEGFPFNSIPPKRFVSMIDFYVYYSHSGMVEAFGRSILEAMASGAVVLLPPSFRGLFEDAAVYREVEQVQNAVRSLYEDRDAYLDQSRKCVQRVRERFSHPSHLKRIADFAGQPPTAGRSTSAFERSRGHRSRVLFVGTNGAGLGHLTRLMAMAKRAPEFIEPIFFTLSQGLPVIRQEGFFAEYMPSRGYLGVRTNPLDWNDNFGERLYEIISTYDPSVIVFDGTLPYQGLVNVAEMDTRRKFVWNRRAMWQADKGARNLKRAGAFDLVIEPGEFAAEADEGMTVGLRNFALCVEPILYLDPSEVLDRETAREALGLEQEKTTILVQMGAGNINDISSPVSLITRRFTREPEVEVAVLSSVIADQEMKLPENIRSVRGYPISKYYRAFDVVVSAAGYNSYHELIGFGIPAIFVPNLDTALDSQLIRARYAEQVGAGVCLERVEPQGLERAAAQVLDPDKREDMRVTCRRLWPGNGAQDAMNAIAELVRTAESEALGMG